MEASRSIDSTNFSNHQSKSTELSSSNKIKINGCIDNKGGFNGKKITLDHEEPSHNTCIQNGVSKGYSSDTNYSEDTLFNGKNNAGNSDINDNTVLNRDDRYLGIFAELDDFDLFHCERCDKRVMLCALKYHQEKICKKEKDPKNSTPTNSVPVIPTKTGKQKNSNRKFQIASSKKGSSSNKVPEKVCPELVPVIPKAAVKQKNSNRRSKGGSSSCKENGTSYISENDSLSSASSISVKIGEQNLYRKNCQESNPEINYDSPIVPPNYLLSSFMQRDVPKTEKKASFKSNIPGLESDTTVNEEFPSETDSTAVIVNEETELENQYYETIVHDINEGDDEDIEYVELGKVIKENRKISSHSRVNLRESHFGDHVAQTPNTFREKEPILPELKHLFEKKNAFEQCDTLKSSVKDANRYPNSNSSADFIRLCNTLKQIKEAKNSKSKYSCQKSKMLSYLKSEKSPVFRLIKPFYEKTKSSQQLCQPSTSFANQNIDCSIFQSGNTFSENSDLSQNFIEKDDFQQNLLKNLTQTASNPVSVQSSDCIQSISSSSILGRKHKGSVLLGRHDFAEENESESGPGPPPKVAALDLKDVQGGNQKSSQKGKKEVKNEKKKKEKKSNPG